MTKASAYSQMKKELSEGMVSQLYLFYGEEDYLLAYYVKSIKKLILSGGLDDFNLTVFDGKGFDINAFSEITESYPVMAERRLVIVRDVDIFKLPAKSRDTLSEILSSLPEFVCVIFIFDTVEYKADKRLKIYEALNKAGKIVEFKRPDKNDLVPWIKRRFSIVEKTIDTRTCEYLMFYCGTLMTALIPEIDKIISYSVRKEITAADIEAVCVKTVEAQIYHLTDEISKKRFDSALSRLSELLSMKNDPIFLLAAINRQLSRLYGAKLAVNENKGIRYVMSMFQYHSEYPAEKLIESARGMELSWLRKAILLCAKTDEKLKSSPADKNDLLFLTVMELSANLQ